MRQYISIEDHEAILAKQNDHILDLQSTASRTLALLERVYEHPASLSIQRDVLAEIRRQTTQTIDKDIVRHIRNLVAPTRMSSMTRASARKVLEKWLEGKDEDPTDGVAKKSKSKSRPSAEVTDLEDDDDEA